MNGIGLPKGRLEKAERAFILPFSLEEGMVLSIPEDL